MWMDTLSLGAGLLGAMAPGSAAPRRTGAGPRALLRPPALALPSIQVLLAWVLVQGHLETPAQARGVGAQASQAQGAGVGSHGSV